MTQRRIEMGDVLDAAAVTHVGHVRARNEDAVAAYGLDWPLENGVVTTFEAPVPLLVVVADGLGGHPGGDQASRTAVEAVLAAAPTDPESLAKAIHHANEAVYAAMDAAADNIGMGSTVAAVLISADGLAIANVGDSEVFVLSDDRLISLSTADSPGGANGLPGVPTYKVTQALGGAASFHAVDPHLREFDHSTDRLLISTDGLTNYVALPVIADSLRAGNVAQAAESLLSLALDAGGLDNITLVVVDVDGPESSRGSR